MLNEMLSPSTLPSIMVDFPIIALVVSPVSLLPSTLKTKVRSNVPFAPDAVPFQVPVMSAANAHSAITAINNHSLPISDAPPELHHYCLITWPSFLRISPQPPFRRLRSPCSPNPKGYFAAAFSSTSMPHPGDSLTQR